MKGKRNMEIINNIKNNERQFCDFTAGTVFIDEDGDVCMKIGASTQAYNAVRLSDGLIFHITNDSLCKIVKATLTIE